MATSEENKIQDSNINFDISKIDAQLKKWQERLLDLSKSNPLLGLNRSRVSKLLVHEPGIETIFNKIVIKNETAKMPLVIIKKKRKQLADGVDESGGAEVEYLIQPGDINFGSQPKELIRLMRRVYDNSRTTMEERGVTTLHLTFGSLNWDDLVLGDSVSPLLLVPCQLEKRGSNSHMLLKMLDEEILVNPALELYLREKHHITLSQFLEESEEPKEESLKNFLIKISNLVQEQSWRVTNEIWLSTFSFESLVVYKDLEAMAAVAHKNSIIAALSHAGEIRMGSEAIGEDLDSLETPETVPVPVLPADSSQLRALAIANTGSHLVVHGPPGTGKSQTITNLIADALGKGKKVLFVSAKMAALNVVHDRLVKLNLGRYCLEAHSTKAGKAKIVEELKRTLELPINNGGGQFEEQLEDLKKLRIQLNNYINEIHRSRSPFDKTIYQSVGRLEKLHHIPAVDFDLPWLDVTEVSRQQFKEKLDVIESLAAQADIFDNRSTHPWRGFVTAEQVLRTDYIKKNLQFLTNNFQELLKKLEKLNYLLVPAKSEFCLRDLLALLDVLNLISVSQGLPRGWDSQDSKELGEQEKLFETASEKAKGYQDYRAEYAQITTLSIRELQNLLQPVNEKFAEWSRVLKPTFWRWKTLIRKQLLPKINLSYTALRSYLQLAKNLETMEAWFDAQGNSLTTHVNNPVENPKELADKAYQYKAAARFQFAISESIIKKPPTEIASIPITDCHQIFQMTELLKNIELKLAIDFINSSWPDGFTNTDYAENSFITLVVARCQELLGAGQKIHEWTVLQNVIKKCRDLDLDNFLAALEKTGAKNSPLIFEKRFLEQWVESTLSTDSSLREFIGQLRDEKINRFKELNQRIQASMLKRIQSKAAIPISSITNAHDGFGDGGEIGILRRELQKRKRIKPLRRLFSEIPRVLQAIKPCMLMSPVSVSTFLKPGALNFDLVVFDEASQLPAQEAIPSILRAKQVVVAGDENQLPPTSFFLASSIFEEEDESESQDEFAPLESLLDDCVAIQPVFQDAKILWHYRSKDERLIKFSNYYFYNNSLITFPSASQDDEGRGVHLIYTSSGTWDRGRSRTNRIEAKKTAETVIEQFQKYPNRTIGVVAMNSSQKEAIECALDELIVNRPDLQAFFDTSKPEPFFVKSLENVQGDERDTIIISVGYAKTPEGALSLNFGPLNRDGGWRRLNVLVTRAKWQTILITSIHSHELGAINPNNRGALMLRNFIEFAEHHCKLPANVAMSTDEETNDFEDAVAAAIRDYRFTVDEQVGASGYRIDLAVRDPRDSNRYILAIECDGATYHSGRTARDRDILRGDVLMSQGWKIYRLWSTDWFRDREKALQGILNAINLAQKFPSEQSVQAVPMAEKYVEQNEQINKSIGYSEAQATIIAAKKKYVTGKDYQKFSVERKKNSKVLLNKLRNYELADVIANIVQVESPIHQDLLIERLKEVYGVSRAGANIHKNSISAARLAVNRHGLKISSKFIYKNNLRPNGFRVPSPGTERELSHIATEEIENAILYLVEDQFGFARERIAKAVLEIFGLGRNRTEPTEIIESAIDRLVTQGELNLNGYTLYIN